MTRVIVNIGSERCENVNGILRVVHRIRDLGIRGEITFVALRDIRAGEELTHDWAMTDDDDYSVECKCGAPNCRKILTGKDWQHSELQKRYAGYFSAYLARKMMRPRKFDSGRETFVEKN